jgi:hypothetical protein
MKRSQNGREKVNWRGRGGSWREHGEMMTRIAGIDAGRLKE